MKTYVVKESISSVIMMGDISIPMIYSMIEKPHITTATLFVNRSSIICIAIAIHLICEMNFLIV